MTFDRFCDIILKLWARDTKNREMKKSQRFFEKPLDKRQKIWYNIRVAARAEQSEEVLKKLQKLLQNLLTNDLRYDIIYKSRARERLKQADKQDGPWKLNSKR